MSREELLEGLRALLASEFELDPAGVTEQARLVEDLDLDSIDGVAIVVRLETQFGVTITDEEIRAMATVGDVIDALVGRRPGGQGR